MQPLAAEGRSALAGILFEMKTWVRFIMPGKYVAPYYPTPDNVVTRMMRYAPREGPYQLHACMHAAVWRCRPSIMRAHAYTCRHHQAISLQQAHLHCFTPAQLHPPRGSKRSALDHRESPQPNRSFFPFQAC